MSTEVYTLTVVADTEVTLIRAWDEDKRTSREPSDGAVPFRVIPGPYHLRADGYKEVTVDVDENMTVELVAEREDVDEDPPLSDGDYRQAGEQLDESFEELQREVEELKAGGGGGSVDYETLAEAVAPYLDSDSVSDEKIRQLMREYSDSHLKDDIIAEVVERVGSGGGDTTELEEEIARVKTSIEDQSIALTEVQNSLSDLEGVVSNIKSGSGVEVDPEQLRTIVLEELSDVREDMENHSDAFEFPARRVGPKEPAGPHHTVPMWGIKFATGRGCYIRSATIDAGATGSFTVVLGETDGVDQFDKVDETKITVDETGVQRVTLDIDVPEEGYYLLTRPGDFPLRRTAWNGWDEYPVDNLRLRAGDKPGYTENDYWYYFFDMEMSASKDHKFST